MVSAVSMIPLKPFSGINDTAETTMIVKFKISWGFQPQKIFGRISAVSLTLLKPFKWCHCHR
jgi:hypothetical protein